MMKTPIRVHIVDFKYMLQVIVERSKRMRGRRLQTAALYVALSFLYITPAIFNLIEFYHECTYIIISVYMY
jgi:hypothetical protein